MLIEDGIGNGYKMGVNKEKRALTQAITETDAAYISLEYEQAYTVVMEDIGPVAGEYSLYLLNNTTSELVLDIIRVSNADADVVWKLHKVTGTAAGAALITPTNMKTGSGKVQNNVIVRGGAGGVTGLTSVGVYYEWFGGGANNSERLESAGALLISPGTAMAIEYDAGTGGKIAISLQYHIRQD